MAGISTQGIASGSIIFPEHILRSIDALNGEAGPFDFKLSGSEQYQEAQKYLQVVLLKIIMHLLL